MHNTATNYVQYMQKRKGGCVYVRERDREREGGREGRKEGEGGGAHTSRAL